MRADTLGDSIAQLLSSPDTFPLHDIAPWQEVIAYQLAHNPPLAAFYRHHGYTSPPASLECLDAWPGISTSAFRLAPLHSLEGPPIRTFLTSGTSAGARGAHRRLNLSAYTRGAVSTFLSHMPPTPPNQPWLALVTDPAEDPHSSLSFMIDVLGRTLAPSPPRYLYHPSTGLDVATLHSLLSSPPPQGYTIFGTSLAFAHYLTSSPSPLPPLPPSSLVIDTGGTKGRRLHTTPETLRTQLSNHLGLPLDRFASEYSMTELSSQAYLTPATRAEYHCPPWLRVATVDPTHGQPLPHGQPGLLRFADLANTDSVAILQTHDLGVTSSRHRFTLRGRSPYSTPRGCSLVIDDLPPTDH